MKFALNVLAAAAAFAVAGAANAQSCAVTAPVGSKIIVEDSVACRGAAATGRMAEIEVKSGTGALYFSNGNGDPINGADPTSSVGGLVGALNVGGVTLTETNGATVDQTILNIGDPGFEEPTLAKVVINAGVTALNANTTTGLITTVNTFGGAQQTAGYIRNILNGGKADIGSLVVDLQAKTVTAVGLGNAQTNRATNPPGTLAPTYGPDVNFSGVLWTFDSVTGPTALDPTKLLAAADGNLQPLINDGYKLVSQVGDLYTVSASNELKGLRITTAGFDFFAKSLGLTPGSTGYTTLQGVNGFSEGWGSLKSDIAFTVREVPEPSTYALMGLGLVGISLVARRRAAQQ